MRARIFRSLSCSFAATAMLAASSASAQRFAPAVRLYAGGNSSIIQGDSISGPLHRTHLLGGVSLSWPIGARFAFEPAAEFVQKGSKSLDTWPSGPFTWSVRISYVEVPLLMRVNAIPWRGITPHVVIGPEVAFKVGCTVSVPGGPPANYVCEPKNRCCDFNDVALTAKPTSTDYGVIGGAGIDLPFGRSAMTIDARYDYGLKDMFENNDTRNRALELIVGLRW